MKLKKANRVLARKYFFLCLSQGRIEKDRTLAVVDFLIQERPRQYFQILREIIRRVRLTIACSQVKVQSAVPLSSEERFYIENRLSSIGKGLEVQFESNAKILGGLRIQIGSEVLDGSISDRLRRIASFPSDTT